MSNSAWQRLLITLAAVAAAACSGPARDSEAKAAVKAVLIDPESAQFSEVFVNESNGAVCGFVNSKNRMGGYAGKALFMYHTAGERKRVLILEEPPSDEDFERAVRATGIKDYLRLEERCREFPEWESACGQKLSLTTSSSCTLINEGKGFTQVYQALRSASGR